MDGASKYSSLPLWKLYVDGSSTGGGGETGLILISPDGTPLKYAMKLHFIASNNEAEYEALLSGLRLVIEMEAQHLISYSDSQLIVNKVKVEFEAKGTKMQEYLAIARALVAKFQYFQICHVPREDNMAPIEPVLIGHRFEPSKLDVGATYVNCASTESN